MNHSNLSNVYALLVLVPLATYTLAVPAPGSLLPGGGAEWKLSWSEEFDEPDAKLEDRWKSQNSGSTLISHALAAPMEAPEAMLLSYFRDNGKDGVFITRTQDFKTFSDAKLYFDRGFASIDAVMKPDPAKKNWIMIIKCSRDESLKTMPGRNLWITRSSGLDTDQPDFSPLVGPIAGNHSPMFTDPSPRKSMAEGPSLLLHNKTWWFVWDEPAGGHLQLATSPDLETWTHRRDTKFPPRAQHGTLFLAPESTVSSIRR